MKKVFLKSMLLLCALIVGSSSAWAVDVTIWSENFSGYSKDDVPSGTITLPHTGTIVDASGTLTYTCTNGNGSKPGSTCVCEESYATGTSPELMVGKYGSGGSTGGTFTAVIPLDNIEGTITLTLYQNKQKLHVYSTTEGVSGGYDEKPSAAGQQTTTFTGITSSMTSITIVFQVYSSNVRLDNIVLTGTKATGTGPVDPSVTIDKSTIVVDGTATISGPDGLSILYSGYDDEVVSVTSAGVVTGLSAGTTTITATWSAVADTYNAGSKDFEVTVVEATIYEKVTDANQLVAGNKYILVATGQNKAMGAQSSSIRNSVSVTIENDQVAITDEAVAVLTLGGETGAWTFLASDNDKYLALNSASNAIHVGEDATEDAAKWTVTNDFELKSVNYDDRILQYNSGSPRFACYSSNQQTAVLFVKKGSDVSTTVNLAAACTDGIGNYYGTYSNEKAFRVPADLTVSAISVSKGKLTVTSYTTGDIVKANTGVMISSTTSGDHSLILTESEGTEISGNMLKASSVAMTGDNLFYRLTMHDGTDLGFWWGAEDGAAFVLAANKAYLAVPTNQTQDNAPARFWMENEENNATDIENVEASEKAIKFFENGQLLIKRDGITYDALGRKIR